MILNFFLLIAQDLIGLKETWCGPCVFSLTLKDYIGHIGSLHKYSFIKKLLGKNIQYNKNHGLFVFWLKYFIAN